MWLIFSCGSAVCGALTSFIAMIGIVDMKSNLATAIRTVVVLVLAWGIVFATGAQTGISHISAKSFLFLILSGLATGLSWICYYHAIQVGPVSKVVPIDKFSVVITMVLAFLFLHERVDAKTVIGGILITAGTLVMIL